MSLLGETEEGVHPSETPLLGQHGSQTEAPSPALQRPDSPVFSVDSSLSTDSRRVYLLRRGSEDFRGPRLSNRSDKSKDAIIDFKESCSPSPDLQRPDSPVFSVDSSLSTGSPGLYEIEGSEDSGIPKLSNRSDKSRDVIIDFKESCSLRVPLESQRSKDLIENVKKSHPSTKKKLPHRVRDFFCRSFRRKSKHVKESLQTI
ncbi:uncharacterized protein [Enoplosus armatus]|uniref:uncharacterized protein n=1 Tax=Enoplosus armatus TaxID=215367 RepID=UPI003991F060